MAQLREMDVLGREATETGKKCFVSPVNIGLLLKERTF